MVVSFTRCHSVSDYCTVESFNVLNLCSKRTTKRGLFQRAPGAVRLSLISPPVTCTETWKVLETQLWRWYLFEFARLQPICRVEHVTTAKLDFWSLATECYSRTVYHGDNTFVICLRSWDTDYSLLAQSVQFSSSRRTLDSRVQCYQLVLYRGLLSVCKGYGFVNYPISTVKYLKLKAVLRPW